MKIRYWFLIGILGILMVIVAKYESIRLVVNRASIVRVYNTAKEEEKLGSMDFTIKYYHPWKAEDYVFLYIPQELAFRYDPMVEWHKASTIEVNEGWTKVNPFLYMMPRDEYEDLDSTAFSWYGLPIQFILGEYDFWLEVTMDGYLWIESSNTIGLEITLVEYCHPGITEFVACP